MTKKYILTNETKEIGFNKTLYRIKAVKDFNIFGESIERDGSD